MIDRNYTSESSSVQNVPAAQDIYSKMSRRVIPGVPSGTQQGFKRYDVGDDEYKWNNIAYLKARSGIVNHFKGYKHFVPKGTPWHCESFKRYQHDESATHFIYWYNSDQTINVIKTSMNIFPGKPSCYQILTEY